MRTSTDDTESLRAFEEFLLGKKDTQTVRKSHNGSFKAILETKGEEDARDFIETNQTCSDFATQPDAVTQMARDYQYLKEKIIRMQQRLDESEDERARLESQLEAVKTENVKFVSDIKVMKNEHSEIMHTMANIEKKIDQLEREN